MSCLHLHYNDWKWTVAVVPGYTKSNIPASNLLILSLSISEHNSCSLFLRHFTLPLLAWSTNYGTTPSRPVCSYNSSIWQQSLSVMNIFTSVTTLWGITLLFFTFKDWEMTSGEAKIQTCRGINSWEFKTLVHLWIWSQLTYLRSHRKFLAGGGVSKRKSRLFLLTNWFIKPQVW